MTTEPAEALILDFGSVVTLTMFETHRFSERNLGLPEGSLTWMGPFDPDNDTLWTTMQRDEITERDYWLTRAREVGQMLGQDWTEMAQFVIAARGKDTEKIIRPEMEPLAEIVKSSGKKLAILSNELDLFFGKTLRQSLRFLDHFDVISDATYTKILKPDPRAYQACLDDLGLEAHQCVFIDDQMRNVVGGQQAGLRSLHLDVKLPLDAFNTALTELGIDAKFTAPGQLARTKDLS
ncbi:Phosphatase/MT3486 [Falsiruegeria litorea R37]|uniref:Phosphatase/MT3486 n=1 Tax=Falsiruegeria litorea R37 TaxID=1200284 RepID=A0A1Y5TYM6_9RHOB|nr:HAD-IA family hydrolase [Falsiruegeria litorea]SLN73685.1 Phosphatase/MT3486 [Falsiruegeria litorea R37]